MKIEWSAAALTDASRFAEFLAERHPAMASRVAVAIAARLELLRAFPSLGRPNPARPEYREIVVAVLNARYIVEYRVSGETIFILRVFHGREHREP